TDEVEQQLQKDEIECAENGNTTAVTNKDSGDNGALEQSLLLSKNDVQQNKQLEGQMEQQLQPKPNTLQQPPANSQGGPSAGERDGGASEESLTAKSSSESPTVTRDDEKQQPKNDVHMKELIGAQKVELLQLQLQQQPITSQQPSSSQKISLSEAKRKWEEEEKERKTPQQRACNICEKRFTSSADFMGHLVEKKGGGLGCRRPVAMPSKSPPSTISTPSKSSIRRETSTPTQPVLTDTPEKDDEMDSPPPSYDAVRVARYEAAAATLPDGHVKRAIMEAAEALRAGWEIVVFNSPTRPHSVQDYCVVLEGQDGEMDESSGMVEVLMPVPPGIACPENANRFYQITPEIEQAIQEALKAPTSNDPACDVLAEAMGTVVERAVAAEHVSCNDDF
ncbi:hypothetical protein PFISCL1PPCAC_27865, partial [Pristionchus fissidentatus]